MENKLLWVDSEANVLHGLDDKRRMFHSLLVRGCNEQPVINVEIDVHSLGADISSDRSHTFCKNLGQWKSQIGGP